jgi:DNA-binding GntR family transcriptional regulator
VIPYKGAVVSDISLQELEEIYEIRVVLERLATRLALNNIETLDIKALRRLAGQVEESIHREDFQDMIVTTRIFMTIFSGFP